MFHLSENDELSVSRFGIGDTGLAVPIWLSTILNQRVSINVFLRQCRVKKSMRKNWTPTFNERPPLKGLCMPLIKKETLLIKIIRKTIFKRP